MLQDDYLEQSARTAAPGTALDLTTMESHNKVLHEMTQMLISGTTADIMKRTMFYKKHDDIAIRLSAATGEKDRLFKALETNPDVVIPAENIDLLHALLGKQSELSEMIQEFVTATVEGRAIDKVNMVEEIGDDSWYTALALRWAGSSFGKAFEANIKKLSVRYPDKFSSESAVVRDLFSERTVLEDNLGSKDGL